MVVFAVELHKLGLEVLAHAGEDGLKVLKRLLGQDGSSIFCNKDQVDVHGKYAVSTMSDIACLVHRPMIH